jgi:NAD(P)-dependent dehydrogenase (short-subunit alcohol dehydrogenase family)
VKLLSAADLRGKKAVVLAGTGPVGRRAAALLAKEGADVVVAETLPTETMERAKAACATIEERFGVQVTPAAAADVDATGRVLEGAEAVLCTGAAGLQLISETLWRGHPTLRVLGDVNAVPPAGIEGVKPTWNGKEIDGKLLFGALGIGDLKMRVHRRSIARLFEQSDLVLDAEEIFALAKELSG